MLLRCNSSRKHLKNYEAAMIHHRFTKIIPRSYTNFLIDTESLWKSAAAINVGEWLGPTYYGSFHSFLMKANIMMMMRVMQATHFGCIQKVLCVVRSVKIYADMETAFFLLSHKTFFPFCLVDQTVKVCGGKWTYSVLIRIGAFKCPTLTSHFTSRVQY